MPLRRGPDRPYAIGADPGRVIGLLLETTDIRALRAERQGTGGPLAGGGGRGGGMGGGMGGGRGGGMGGGMGGGQGSGRGAGTGGGRGHGGTAGQDGGSSSGASSPDRNPKPLDLALRIRLAAPPRGPAS